MFAGKVILNRPANQLWQAENGCRWAFKLLDKISRAIIMTHSESGSDGYLAANLRPELIVGVVTIEPMKPAFGTTPGIRTLNWDQVKY